VDVEAKKQSGPLMLCRHQRPCRRGRPQRDD